MWHSIISIPIFHDPLKQGCSMNSEFIIYILLNLSQSSVRQVLQPNQLSGAVLPAISTSP